MILIKNATLINERERIPNSAVLIEGERIKKIYKPGDKLPDNIEYIVDATGLLLLPGMIDDQVHFREPGLTHKGDIYSESRAAVSGGITSFMDMPNTIPQTTTVDALNEKFDRAAQSSLANYSFFIGATNDNIDELKKEGAKRAAAVKLFMGSSTGNMLVDNDKTLDKIFTEVDMLIASHCECETTIQANKKHYIEQYGEDLGIEYHAKIRSSEACYNSSSQAVRLARKHNSRLHLFHLSTQEELSLLDSAPLSNKKITGEVCIHHLWFSSKDYESKGNFIKWNPAIKDISDREALRQAVIDGKIDIIATDHAPHSMEEKEGSCLIAASGGPMVQHALIAMLELCRQGIFTEELVVEKMAHNPAELFRIKERGYIREGYYADLVLVDPNKQWKVSKENLHYKCGWSPMEGITFNHQIKQTYINGTLVYDEGKFNEHYRGKELCFR